MPRAKRPSGPGKPTTEQQDAVTRQEGLDELQAERGEATGQDRPTLPDPSTSARHAERDAHPKRVVER